MEAKIVPHIRWLIRRDADEVLAIERDVFEFYWTLDDFVRSLKNLNCVAQVAEIDDRVAGYMIYEFRKTRLHVLNFAIAADFQRRGIGSQMLAKLIGKLHPQRRTRIVLEVRERNVPAQLFFAANGFRAVSVLKRFYDDTDEDAYLMQYLVHQPVNLETIRVGDCAE